MDSFKNSDLKDQIDLEEGVEGRIPVPSSAELMREEFKDFEEADLVVIQTFNLVTLLKKASLCCPAQRKTDHSFCPHKMYDETSIL